MLRAGRAPFGAGEARRDDEVGEHPGDEHDEHSIERELVTAAAGVRMGCLFAHVRISAI